MSLHYTPMILTAKATHQTADCGTGGVDSTSGGVFNGSVIDRLALGPAFTHAQPFLIGKLPGSTSTGKVYRSVAVKLRHGDSSGGGDLADYQSGMIPSAVAYGAVEARTTEWKNYTTGDIRLQASSVAYPLLGAKRFITAAGTISGPGASTSTAAGDLVTASLGVAMVRADQENQSDLGMMIGGIRDILPATSTAT
jgi:hypothetical protein